MQGNCTGPQPGNLGLQLDPPPSISNRQCVLIVREDFVVISTYGSNSPVWLSNIYIALAPVKHNSTTLIHVDDGDVYLTATTFVGDAYNVRAMEVHRYGRVYIDSALLNWVS